MEDEVVARHDVFHGEGDLPVDAPLGAPGQFSG
jgi:hypothetical protein